MKISKRKDTLEGTAAYSPSENNLLIDLFLANFSMFCLSLVVQKKIIVLFKSEHTMVCTIPSISLIVFFSF